VNKEPATLAGEERGKRGGEGREEPWVAGTKLGEDPGGTRAPGFCCCEGGEGNRDRMGVIWGDWAAEGDGR